MTEPNLEPATAKAEEPSDGGSLVVDAAARARNDAKDDAREEPPADESGPVRKSRMPSRPSAIPRALAARGRERRIVRGLRLQTGTSHSIQSFVRIVRRLECGQKIGEISQRFQVFRIACTVKGGPYQVDPLDRDQLAVFFLKILEILSECEKAIISSYSSVFISVPSPISNREWNYRIE